MQSLPKDLAERVRLKIEVGIHKGAALGPVEIDMRCIKASLQLAEYFFERMALAVTAHCDLFRPVGADDQQRITGKSLPEVKKHGARRPVHPVQVIDPQ